MLFTLLEGEIDVLLERKQVRIVYARFSGNAIVPEIVSVQERFGVYRTHWPGTEFRMSTEADRGFSGDSHRTH